MLGLGLVPVLFFFKFGLGLELVSVLVYIAPHFVKDSVRFRSAI